MSPEAKRANAVVIGLVLTDLIWSAMFCGVSSQFGERAAMFWLIALPSLFGVAAVGLFAIWAMAYIGPGRISGAVSPSPVPPLPPSPKAGVSP